MKIEITFRQFATPFIWLFWGILALASLGSAVALVYAAITEPGLFGPLAAICGGLVLALLAIAKGAGLYDTNPKLTIGSDKQKLPKMKVL